MLINMRDALIAGKSLPYDAEVAYLESTGTQYIDTGIRGAGEGYLALQFLPLVVADTTRYWRYFGASNGATASVRTIGVLSQNRVLFENGYNGVTVGVLGNVCEIEKTKYRVPEGEIIGDKNFLLFTYNDLVNAGSSRIYYCKLWDSFGNLVRDFTPVRKGSVGYKYDRVSGNQGTGAFLYGNDI